MKFEDYQNSGLFSIVQKQIICNVAVARQLQTKIVHLPNWFRLKLKALVNPEILREILILLVNTVKFRLLFIIHLTLEKQLYRLLRAVFRGPTGLVT